MKSLIPFLAVTLGACGAPAHQTQTLTGVATIMHPTAERCGPMLPIPASVGAIPDNKKVTARVRFLVSPTGEVSRVVLWEGSGYQAFDNWAVASIDRWRCPEDSGSGTFEVLVAIEFKN